jgi:hypothetical protein
LNLELFMADIAMLNPAQSFLGDRLSGWAAASRTGKFLNKL